MYNYDLTRQPKSKLTLLAAEARRWTLFAVDATTRMEHRTLFCTFISMYLNLESTIYGITFKQY